jgi:Zn-dependent protease with chaperone function
VDYGQLDEIYNKALEHPYFRKAFTYKNKFQPPKIVWESDNYSIGAWATQHECTDSDIVIIPAGTMEAFEKDEILFIVGHELVHHVFRDTRRRPISYHVKNVGKGFLAFFILFSLMASGALSPLFFFIATSIFAALFSVYWYSKSKTYWHTAELRADLESARLFGFQPGINTLVKIEKMFGLASPDGLETKTERWASYFDEHPTFDYRIKQLQTYFQIEGL